MPVVPYPQWLTDEAALYWTAAGFDVAQTVTVGGGNPYILTSADVTAALAQLRPGTVDAIVMSGTGMLTLPAILQARETVAVPFLSSNLCCAWWLMRVCGQPAPSPIFSAVAPELAAAL